MPFAAVRTHGQPRLISSYIFVPEVLFQCMACLSQLISIHKSKFFLLWAPTLDTRTRWLLNWKVEIWESLRTWLSPSGLGETRKALSSLSERNAPMMKVWKKVPLFISPLSSCKRVGVVFKFLQCVGDSQHNRDCSQRGFDSRERSFFSMISFETLNGRVLYKGGLFRLFVRGRHRWWNACHLRYVMKTTRMWKSLPCIY